MYAWPHSRQRHSFWFSWLCVLREHCWRLLWLRRHYFAWKHRGLRSTAVLHAGAAFGVVSHSLVAVYYGDILLLLVLPINLPERPNGRPGRSSAHQCNIFCRHGGRTASTSATEPSWCHSTRMVDVEEPVDHSNNNYHGQSNANNNYGNSYNNSNSNTNSFAYGGTITATPVTAYPVKT